MKKSKRRKVRTKNDREKRINLSDVSFAALSGVLRVHVLRLQFCRCNTDIHQAQIVVSLRRAVINMRPFHCSIFPYCV